MRSGGLDKKRRLFNQSRYGDREEFHNINKNASELKDQEKTVKTANKQDLSPDLYLLDYAIWGILENKTNATSHPNIGSLKTTIEEEEKKYLKNLFWRHANRSDGVLIQ